MFLHELNDNKEVFLLISSELNVRADIAEKDYWLMHCLWGLKEQGFQFDLKGGTSLSKGFGLIHRFSEDVDIKIYSSDPNLKIGKNHVKPAHIASRLAFFDDLALKIKIPGIVNAVRDKTFDDSLARNGGIRLNYPTHFDSEKGLKEGILLEVGFDTTTPNQARDISSWAYEKAKVTKPQLKDNRAIDIRCYLPGFTLVEKLQTISTKYRQFFETGNIPPNFIRHYYDVYCLLHDRETIQFIGTEAYLQHKNARFRPQDEKDLTKNEAFLLSDQTIKKKLSEQYIKSKALYYGSQPSLDEMLNTFERFLNKL